MLIMPMVMLWLWSAWQPSIEFTSPVLILMSLSMFGGFSFELARKIHSPDAERNGQDSYSKTLGLKGAVIAVLHVLGVGVMTQFALLQLIDAGIWSYLLIASLFVFALLFYFRATQSKDQKLFRKAELIVSLFMLISYVSIIIETSIK